MKLKIIIILILLGLNPHTVFAQRCAQITTKDKILLKLHSLKDDIYLFLLADVNKQIKYHLTKADSLYTISSNAADPSVSFSLSLQAENHITQIPKLLQHLPSTQSFDMNGYEKQQAIHTSVIRQMKSECEWNILLGFIDSNYETIKKIYVVKLPTDQQRLLY
ncbi:MAG: hypothetical protein WAV51_02900 [Microgenomates group bacterium]